MAIRDRFLEVLGLLNCLGRFREWPIFTSEFILRIEFNFGSGDSD
jgi:hypothetical protein